MSAEESASKETLHELHCECFACGANNPIGLNLCFTINREGRALATWQPAAEFRSYSDRVHGGVIATLLDSSIVHALFAQGVAGVTAELTIRYLHGVNAIEPVQVTGWVESRKRSVYYCEAEARQGGVLAVRASAKFMSIPRE